MSRTCLSIILAAGEGKRMQSSLPKVLHPVANLPMVNHVLNTAKAAGIDRRAVVVGNQAELVTECVHAHDPSVSMHVQTERKGTAHAVLAARAAVAEGYDDVLILAGDVPLIQTGSLTAAREALAGGADVVVLGFETDNPTGYGRMILLDGELTGIREHKDASDEEKEITFCNSGILAFRGDNLLSILDAINNDNAQGEYYLPDAIEVAHGRGMKVSAIEVSEEDTLGVNDRAQLAGVEAIWQARRRNQMMLAGVAMAAPDTVIFSHDTIIGKDTKIEPYVVFENDVTVGDGAQLRSFSHFEGASVGDGAVVGPYARLRPGSELAAGTKVGNFVETKNAKVAEGAKINHLSYVGDANVGPKANVGAGTVTCNYDGVNKHQTIIGRGAFIGTNSSLVAPVTVGDHAMTAAGSVITQNVPDGAVAIERNKQSNLDGLAIKLRKRNEAIKAAKKK